MAKERAFGHKILARPVGNPTWSVAVNIKDIDGPSQSKDVIDVTTHDSASSYIERLPGLKDGGTVSFEVEWAHANEAGSGALWGSAFTDVANLYEFAIVSPTGSVNGYLTATTNVSCWRFTGIVTKLGPALPVGGSIRMSIELTVTGPVTYYPAS